MKITLLVTLLFGLVFLTAVGATEKPLTPQQQRMTTCNQQATAQALKGDARKTYRRNRETVNAATAAHDDL
ncbi:phosphate starvation-inducible protein psiF [Salmonella enterica]|nr:phosphate starvation-inducible protein psiF [Salmonella enterica]